MLELDKNATNLAVCLDFVAGRGFENRALSCQTRGRQYFALLSKMSIVALDVAFEQQDDVQKAQEDGFCVAPEAFLDLETLPYGGSLEEALEKCDQKAIITIISAVSKGFAGRKGESVRQQIMNSVRGPPIIPGGELLADCVATLSIAVDEAVTLASSQQEQTVFKPDPLETVCDSVRLLAQRNVSQRACMQPYHAPSMLENVLTLAIDQLGGLAEEERPAASPAVQAGGLLAEAAFSSMSAVLSVIQPALV
jgi:hypothetical protein